MIKTPTLTQLLEAGVHFGHQARRWNPKMKRYIFTVQSGVHIIDLEKTQQQLKEAADFIKKVAVTGGRVIFLATKKQTAEIVKSEAQRAGAMYLTHRWVGGLLTNFESVKKSLEKLPALEEKLKDESLRLTKKEQLLVKREIDKLTRFIGGIRTLEKLPDALVIVDSRKEENAVREAKKMEVPVVALVDTNADPTQIDYPIAANDDAIKSVTIVIKTLADAYEEGSRLAEKKAAMADASKEAVSTKVGGSTWTRE
ncbi:MAG TPA: 30S ribosomal protein S2 [Candidatus Nanoarchaeia archaeon]